VSIRSWLSREFVRVGIHTYAFAVLTLGANFVSGVVTARALAPAGRGEAVAIAMLIQNIAFIFALGCVHAVSYRYAREPETAGALATTWTLVMIPLALLAFAVGQLALPALFGSQSHHAIELARVYLPAVALILWIELTNGLLLGAKDYRFVNAIRFAQPALFALAQVLVWRIWGLTVASSLGTWIGSMLICQCVATVRVQRNIGRFAKPDLRLGLETAWYGLRGHGAFLANNLNQRLDLLIMPAFIAAVGLGLYTVAANVSLIVSTLAFSFASIVLPAAARDPERAARTVLGSLQAALGIAAVLACTLFVLARPALEAVYGAKFAGAAPALRVLLPGTALLAGASILVAGLYAANRPSIATGVQLAGLAVTVGGLLIFLPGHGIMVAAIVSTVSYTTVFVGAVLAYKRVAGLRWRAFMTAPMAVRAGKSVA
jgi:O-antigen/teichoic acid export membrane protein